MDIKCLRYFVGIAEAGSILRASERLHVAQPALSVNLANLEAELGVKLMERTRRGVLLTFDGRVLYQRAKDLLACYQETVTCLKDRVGRPSGRVSIGMSSTNASLFAVDLYRCIRDKYPEIEIYITDAGSASRFEWLTERRLDFAVMYSLPDEGEFETVPMYEDEFCLVTRSDLAKGGDTVAFSSIFNQPLVISSQATAWRKVLDDVAERHGRRISSVIETEAVNVIMSIVMAGEASSVLPYAYVRSEVEKGRLIAQRLIDPELRVTISLASLAGMEMTPAQRAVRDVIVDIARHSSKLNGPLGTDANVVSALRAFPTPFVRSGAAKASRRSMRAAF